MRRLIVLVCAAILACVALTACNRTTLEYIPHGGTYTMAEAEDIAASVSLASVSGAETSDGPELRKERLLDLRANGEEASQLADALTRDFPSETASVPLLIEGATVDGTSVWLIVEAWGDKEGNLSRRRLWVLDRSSFNVLGASSFN